MWCSFYTFPVVEQSHLLQGVSPFSLCCPAMDGWYANSSPWMYVPQHSNHLLSPCQAITTPSLQCLLLITQEYLFSCCLPCNSPGSRALRNRISVSQLLCVQKNGGHQRFWLGDLKGKLSCTGCSYSVARMHVNAVKTYLFPSYYPVIFFFHVRLLSSVNQADLPATRIWDGKRKQALCVANYNGARCQHPVCNCWLHDSTRWNWVATPLSLDGFTQDESSLLSAAYLLHACFDVEILNLLESILLIMAFHLLQGCYA